MSRSILPHRSPECILTDEEIKFFYEEILLYFECDRKSFGTVESLKQASKNIEDNSKFKFEYKDYENMIESPVENVFYFSAESKKENAARENTEIVKNWFFHLRNAFAHNYIIKKDSSYILKDFQKKGQNWKQTLYVEITSFDSFKSLVNEVKRINDEPSNNITNNETH